MWFKKFSSAFVKLISSCWLSFVRFHCGNVLQCILQFNHSSFDRHLSWFHFLAVIQIIQWWALLYLFHVCKCTDISVEFLRMELLGCEVCTHSTLIMTECFSKLFQFIIPTQWEFPLFYILSTWYCQTLIFTNLKGVMVSHGFNLHFHDY